MDDPDHYSLQDLIDVKSGELAEFLGRVLENFEDHIRGCVLCAAKGFFCELCDNRGAIQSDFESLLNILLIFLVSFVLLWDTLSTVVQNSIEYSMFC